MKILSVFVFVTSYEDLVSFSQRSYLDSDDGLGLLVDQRLQRFKEFERVVADPG